MVETRRAKFPVTTHGGFKRCAYSGAWLAMYPSVVPNEHKIVKLQNDVVELSQAHSDVLDDLKKRISDLEHQMLTLQQQMKGG